MRTSYQPVSGRPTPTQPRGRLVACRKAIEKSTHTLLGLGGYIILAAWAAGLIN